MPIITTLFSLSTETKVYDRDKVGYCRSENYVPDTAEWADVPELYKQGKSLGLD